YHRKVSQLGNHKIGLLIILFFILHLVGLLYTADKSAGLFDIEKKLSLLIIPLILFSSPLTLYQRDFILASFILFCVFLALIGLGYGIIHYKEVVSSKGPEHLVTYISSIHRVYFSIYLLFGYFLVFYFYRKFRLGYIPVLKWTSLGFAGLLAFLIIIMASRAVLILLIMTTAVIIFYFVVIKRKQYLKAGILSGLGVLVLILVYTQVGYVRKIVNDLTQDLDKGKTVNVTSVNLRVEKYKCAIQAIKSNWLVGVGTGDVQATLDSYYHLNNFYEGYKYSLDAHNQYLQTWIGLGLPGILLFLSLLILSLITGVKELNYVLIYFIVLFSVCCLSESLLTTQKGIIFFALFYPLIISNRSNLAALYSPYSK
ncbi:MAG: O-antigen ligase family protein, partial [Opitutaceae bacterium]|nr:O-antigen ligase family protein [Cytophagales bacterium]